MDTDGTSMFFDHYLIAEIMIDTCSLGTGMYVGENVAFSRCFLLDGRQTVYPTVSQTQERDVLYPPSRHREREEG